MKILDNVKFSDQLLDVDPAEGATPAKVPVQANMLFTSGYGIGIGNNVSALPNGVNVAGTFSGAAVRTTDGTAIQSLTVGADSTTQNTDPKLLVRSKEHYTVDANPSEGVAAYYGPPKYQALLKCDRLLFNEPWGDSSSNGVDTVAEVSSGGLFMTRHLHGSSGKAWSGSFKTDSWQYADDSCGRLSIDNSGMEMVYVNVVENQPPHYKNAHFKYNSVAFSGDLDVYHAGSGSSHEVLKVGFSSPAPHRHDGNSLGVYASGAYVDIDVGQAGLNVFGPAGIRADAFDFGDTATATSGTSSAPIIYMSQYNDATSGTCGQAFRLVVSSGVVHDDCGWTSGYVVFAVPAY